jgi:hypothetical protein
MGLGVNALRFLLLARASGVDLSRTAMIGRQGLHLSGADLDRVARTEFGLSIDRHELLELQRCGYADALLGRLGANTVDAFDASAYERANRVHDFNDPLPAAFAQRYSTVLESGTLEHVFNFPVAILNCMRLLEVGGHYVGITPANNFMGHGFYQFSPELFHRLLAPVNGFRILRLVIFEGRDSRRWFAVPDPRELRQRVEVINGSDTTLAVLAQKTMHFDALQVIPQQADYVAAWNQKEGPVRRRRSLLGALRRHVPAVVRHYVNVRLGRTQLVPFDPLSAVRG